jgi:hypothetical protein
LASCCSAERGDRFGLNEHEYSRKDFPAKGSAAPGGGIILTIVTRTRVFPEVSA